MGLDIYLEKCENLIDAEMRQNRYYETSEAIWNEYGPYDLMTEEQKDEARSRCDQAKADLGLDSSGRDPGRIAINEDSAKFPDHMFKVGYFRSSYNDGGIESILSAMGLDGLCSIFGGNGDYYVRPDWATAKEKATHILNEFRVRIDNDDYLYGVHHDSILEMAAKSKEDALALFQSKMQKTRDGHGFKNFSCSEGSFYLDGLDVRAIIPGSMFGHFKGYFIIYKKDREHFDWYEQALQIVVETIDYVLQQSDPQNYYLRWSG